MAESIIQATPSDIPTGAIEIDDAQLESIAGGYTFSFYAKFFLACSNCGGEWAFVSDTISDSDYVCPYCSSSNVRVTNAVQLPSNEWLVES